MDAQHGPARQANGGAAPEAARSGGTGLRARLLGAILVVALATIAVGVVGINRMAALSEKADQVYTEGAQPLDGLRQLQADWWQLSTYTARAAIAALPPEQIQSAQQSAAAMGQTLTEETAA